MKLYEVEWEVRVQHMLGLQSGVSSKNKKAFTEKDKADAYYKTLWEAAGILRCQGSFEGKVYEVEIE